MVTEDLHAFQSREFDVPTFSVEVVSGPDQGLSARSMEGRLTVGRAEGVSLRLNDRAVSKWHIELVASPSGIVLRDFGSSNGTRVRGLLVRDVTVCEDVEVEIGRSRLRLTAGDEREPVRLPTRDSFGGLVGGSHVMRKVYQALERVAPTNLPVLITGETGTGKELAARAIHDASPRAKRPYCVVDCSVTMNEQLIVSELFGHKRHTFTDAKHDRKGAFEEADGGTVLLDEVGELPVALQQTLLRVLAEGQVKRLGENHYRKVDVRILAATNRDLRQEINLGRFREDLYHRLAAYTITIPPLRERTEDLQQIVEALIERFRERDGRRDRPWRPDEDFYHALLRHHWPGNVRELANRVWGCLALGQDYAHEVDAATPSQPPTVAAPPAPETPAQPHDESLTQQPWREAKKRVIERFEREYIQALLQKTNNNRERAAELAGIDRTTFYRALNRHGLGNAP